MGKCVGVWERYKERRGGVEKCWGGVKKGVLGCGEVLGEGWKSVLWCERRCGKVLGEVWESVLEGERCRGSGKVLGEM